MLTFCLSIIVCILAGNRLVEPLLIFIEFTMRHRIGSNTHEAVKYTTKQRDTTKLLFISGQS